MNRKTLLAVAVSSLVVSAYLAALYAGFEGGYDYSKEQWKDCVGYGMSGGTAYSALSRCHVIILLSVVPIILINLLGRRMVLEIVAACCCLVALWQEIYWFQALKYIGEGYGSSFYDLLRETVLLGWVSAALVLMLTTLQIASLFRIRKERPES